MRNPARLVRLALCCALLLAAGAVPSARSAHGAPRREKPASIVVTVLDLETGRPLPHAAVGRIVCRSAEIPASGRDPLRVPSTMLDSLWRQADAKARYCFRDLPPGHAVQVRAWAPGHYEGVAWTVPEPGKREQVTMRLRTLASVVFVVRDSATGASLPASVRLGGFPEARTDSSGVARFGGLQRGRMQYTVSSEGYVTAEAAFVVERGARDTIVVSLSKP